MRRIDLTGQRFGRLVVTCPEGLRSSGFYWAAECDCGSPVVVRADHLRRGKIRSCGCFNAEQTRQRNATHGNTRGYDRTSTYSTWLSMRRRCDDPTDPDYGGRGISVCREWQTFEQFLSDMGERPPGMTIERRDSSEGYTKDNCVWATTKEQNRNRRGVHRITLCGSDMAVTAACEVYGVKHQRVINRSVRHRISRTEAFLDLLPIDEWGIPRNRRVRVAA